MKIFSSLLLALACVLSINVSAHAADKKFKMIEVAELKSWLAKDAKAVHIFDANSDNTRNVEGMIPGAKALSSSDEYDVAKELPTDKNAKLVFYCYNKMCGASHDAAERATDAGYADVSVFSPGITGWKSAGEKAVMPGKSL